MNTYKKHRGEGVLLLTRHPMKDVCPERPSEARDPSSSTPQGKASDESPACRAPGGACPPWRGPSHAQTAFSSRLIGFGHLNPVALPEPVPPPAALAPGGGFGPF